MKLSLKQTNPLPSVKGIVFDLDGTLVDSKDLVLASFQHALSDFGIQITLEDIERIRRSSKEDLFSFFLKKEDAQIAIKRLWQYSNQNAGRAKLYPGMREVLTALQEKGVSLGVWTARDHKSALSILQANEVAHFFQGVMGSCLVAENKPHPEGLDKLIDLYLPHSKDEILMIGDHADDILGAKGAGTLSAAAKWGYPEAHSQPTHHHPDFVFETLEEFKNWVQFIK